MKDLRDRVVVGAVATIARAVVVAWAATIIPPSADGTYYHVLATRIATGQGYTWLWPDGVVTYAAHYPVGYPALIAGPYALFGAKAVFAMIVNALLGVASAIAIHDVLLRATRRRLALAGGLAIALHPALVPYTAAIMTEGVTASLLAVALAFADRARVSRSRAWIVAAGLTMGVATLVRPQSLVLAPVLGFLVVRGLASRISFAAGVTALALVVCAPWTARNCTKMERCALVSVNGGWNLAIGTQTTDGGWAPIDVPEPCKTVFQEAAKDGCFGRDAMAAILAHPGAWLARAPKKLSVTFDYFGAAPWYLHTANAERFPYRAKVVLGTIETVFTRVMLAAALFAMLPRRRWLSVLGIVLPGAITYPALGVLALRRGALLPRFAGATILATALTHAVFFGAGRYGLVVLPLVTALAFFRDGGGRPPADVT